MFRIWYIGVKRILRDTKPRHATRTVNAYISLVLGDKTRQPLDHIRLWMRTANYSEKMIDKHASLMLRRLVRSRLIVVSETGYSVVPIKRSAYDVFTNSPSVEHAYTQVVCQDAAKVKGWAPGAFYMTELRGVSRRRGFMECPNLHARIREAVKDEAMAVFNDAPRRRRVARCQSPTHKFVKVKGEVKPVLLNPSEALSLKNTYGLLDGKTRRQMAEAAVKAIEAPTTWEIAQLLKTFDLKLDGSEDAPLTNRQFRFLSEVRSTGKMPKLVGELCKFKTVRDRAFKTAAKAVGLYRIWMECKREAKPVVPRIDVEPIAKVDWLAPNVSDIRWGGQKISQSSIDIARQMLAGAH